MNNPINDFVEKEPISVELKYKIPPPADIHKRTQARKYFKYQIEEKNDTGEVVFKKKYKSANEIQNEIPLLNKDRISDMINGRYKGKKRVPSYEILKNITITKIKEPAYTITENQGQT